MLQIQTQRIGGTDPLCFRQNQLERVICGLINHSDVIFVIFFQTSQENMKKKNMEIPREFHARIKHSSKINKSLFTLLYMFLLERHNPNFIFDLT